MCEIFQANEEKILKWSKYFLLLLTLPILTNLIPQDIFIKPFFSPTVEDEIIRLNHYIKEIFLNMLIMGVYFGAAYIFKKRCLTTQVLVGLGWFTFLNFFNFLFYNYNHTDISLIVTLFTFLLFNRAFFKGFNVKK